MPRWVRWLQPLLSGVFTVDNLDYVRRDAYLTGVAVGPVDAERLRRYAFISERGLTLYESGLPAPRDVPDGAAASCTSRSTSTGRCGRSTSTSRRSSGRPIRALFGDGSPADRLAAYADLDEYALLHQAARWARGEDVSAADARVVPGDGRVTADIADGWRAILLRRPRWRAEAEVRAEYEAGDGPTALIASLGAAEPGRVAIDLAIVDARPADITAAEPRLALEARDGSPGPSLGEALSRIPGFSLIGRRYRRIAG